MSDHPAEPGEGADDLIGRWLAHHEKPSDDGDTPRPRRVPSAARPSEAATPMSRPSASAALAGAREAAVDKRDGLGPVAPPSAFGVKRGLPGSAHSGPSGTPRRAGDGEVAELDRESPAGFEPVILRSVRKKSEPKDEPDKDKLGRLKRLRARVAGPLEEDGSDASTAQGEQVAPPPLPAFAATPLPPPPVFQTPVPAAVEPEPEPAPEATPEQKRKIVAYEDMIALATMAALPDTEPEPVEPEPEPAPLVETSTPVPEPEPFAEPESVVEPVVDPEPVLPGPELETPPSPHPVLPEHQDDEVPPMSGVVVESPTPPSRRRLVARPKARPETDEPKRKPLVARGPSEPSTADAARGMLAAARAATPVVRDPRPAPAENTPAGPMAPAANATANPAASATGTAVDLAVPIAPKMDMPPVYEFAALKTSRRFLTLMLLGGLILSGYLGYAAYLSRETVEIGIAAIVIFATLVIWGIRAGASVTRLTVRSGQLEIVRQGGRQVFDLTSHYTPIEVIGKPGSKKWKVLFLRRGMAPAVVDSSMVDGKDFMRILGFFRPELVPVKK